MSLATEAFDRTYKAYLNAKSILTTPCAPTQTVSSKALYIEARSPIVAISQNIGSDAAA
jgi:hypothetical protein